MPNALIRITAATRRYPDGNAVSSGMVNRPLPRRRTAPQAVSDGNRITRLEKDAPSLGLSKRNRTNSHKL
jgi:hypothetical protein